MALKGPGPEFGEVAADSNDILPSKPAKEAKPETAEEKEARLKEEARLENEARIETVKAEYYGTKNGGEGIASSPQKKAHEEAIEWFAERNPSLGTDKSSLYFDDEGKIRVKTGPQVASLSID